MWPASAVQYESTRLKRYSRLHKREINRVYVRFNCWVLKGRKFVSMFLTSEIGTIIIGTAEVVKDMSDRLLVIFNWTSKGTDGV